MLNDTFWEKYFSVYDALNKLIPYQELLNQIVLSAGELNDKKILDAGSGTGNLSVLLSMSGATVTGIDYSRVGVSIHKSKLPNSKVVVSNLCDLLPFESSEFDVVVSNNTLYTIPRKERESIAHEFFRVLKPGGRVVISNLKVNFSPLKIYIDHLQKSLSVNGFLKTVYTACKLIHPTIKIFYYNKLIQNENRSGSYDFFEDNEQSELLIRAGFSKITLVKDVYSKQGELVVALK